MTIEVGAAASSISMPSYMTTLTNRVTMKSAAGTVSTAGAAAFWTAIDLSHTHEGYEAVKLTAAADTTEQTILDITDSGVLATVVAPELVSAGTMTIRVTIDGGTAIVFLSETITAGGRFLLGGILGAIGEATAANGQGIGSANDEGFAVNSNIMILTPPQTLQRGNIGMVFKTSLKVTIQGSVNVSGVANDNNCCANYALLIPEGL